MDNQDELIDFLRNGIIKQEQNDGGYLVPKKIKVKKTGITAWIWRLLKAARGFEYVNFHEYLTEKINAASINK